MANTKSIPTHPTLYFRGLAQSQEFTDAALAAAKAIDAMDGAASDHDSPSELDIAAAFRDRLMTLIDAGEESRAGALAAVAHFIVWVQQGSVPTPGQWTPLERDPAYYTNVLADAGVPPDTIFFAVGETPVSVSPELCAYQWTGERYRETQRIEIDVVRSAGRPIGERTFRRMVAVNRPTSPPPLVKPAEAVQEDPESQELLALLHTTIDAWRRRPAPDAPTA